MLSRTVVRATGLSRSFSVLSAVRTEGKPAGHGETNFNKRERAEEDRYVRDHEMEKLKALKKSVEASKAHLEQLERDQKELEKSLNSSEKK